MLLNTVVPCRVDYRPATALGFCEWTGRVEFLSTNGCTILTAQRPEPGATLELRIYLPGSDWPIRVHEAEVIWSHWDVFTVEFISLTAGAQSRLRRCLEEATDLAAI